MSQSIMDHILKPAEPAPMAGTPEPATETPETDPNAEGVEETEPTPIPPPVDNKQADEFSKKFAALAQRERMAVQKMQEAKARELEFAERERKMKEREAWLDQVESSPLEALKAKGWSYEDITNAALSGVKDLTPEMRVKKLESQVEARFKAQEEAEKARIEVETQRLNQAREQAMQEFKEQTHAFIESNADKYELTNLYGQADLVIATIESHYEKTQKEGKPKVLSQAEAADLVEKYLEAELDKATKTKKFQARTAAPVAPGKEPTTTRTISAAQPSTMKPTGGPARTEEERLARALAKLNGVQA